MEVRNQGPQIKWRGRIMACGTRRQRLFLNGEETPFFIDSAQGVRAHRTTGEEHGLYGAGMGPDGGNKQGLRIAAVLGSGRNAALLKHHAEQMALAFAESLPLQAVA